jgi:heme/copper-type cytochrome/quinol oxidase subunit 1
MHFLGLSGMPRRIPDYPDAYSFLNYICSLGAMLTLFSIFVFMLVIYYTFTSEFVTIRINTKNKGSYILYYGMSLGVAYDLI